MTIEERVALLERIVRALFAAEVGCLTGRHDRQCVATDKVKALIAELATARKEPLK
jgi:hypothetical protein